MTKEKSKTIDYFKEAIITCACGQEFRVGSTRKEINVDVCSNCHPFYTGEGKLVDTSGRVERFQKLLKRSRSLSSSKQK